MDTRTLKAILILTLTKLFLCQCNGSIIMIEEEVTENAPLIAQSNIGKPLSEGTSDVQLVMHVHSSSTSDSPLATITQTSSSQFLPVVKDTVRSINKNIALSQNSYIRVTDPSYLALAAAASFLVVSRRRRNRTLRTK